MQDKPALIYIVYTFFFPGRLKKKQLDLCHVLTVHDNNKKTWSQPTYLKHVMYKRKITKTIFIEQPHFYKSNIPEKYVSTKSMNSEVGFGKKKRQPQ